MNKLILRGFLANESWEDSSGNLMPTWREVAKTTVSDTGYVAIPNLVGFDYEFESYEKIGAAMRKFAASIAKTEKGYDWITVVAYHHEEALISYELGRVYPDDEDFLEDDFDPRYYTKPGYC